MIARVLKITAKRRRDPIGVVGPKDFRTKIAAEASASVLLEDPSYSLYCLNFRRRTAWFVKTPLEADLYAETFYYQGQYYHGQEFVEVDWETFHRLAEELPSKLASLVLLYSVGRCGSTLLSQMLHQLPSCCSLSEPDVYTQLLEVKVPHEELKALLRSTTLWYTHRIDSPNCLLKFRAQCFRQAEWMQELFPTAKCWFMYRNAEKFVRSAMRSYYHFRNLLWWVEQAKYVGLQSAFINLQMNLNAEILREYLPWLLKTRRVCSKSLIHFFTGFWVALLDLQLQMNREFPIRSFRYEELLTDPEELLRELLGDVGIPSDDLSGALEVMQRDSQQHSELARHKVRGWELPSTAPQQMAEVFACHSTIHYADFVIKDCL